MIDAFVVLPAVRRVLAAYGCSAHCVVTPLAGGLINQTYLVEDAGRRMVLQRLHLVFAAEVNLDIEAITAQLAAHGLMTPRLCRTTTGALWTHDDEGRVWRMLDFLPGRTQATIEQLASARSAAGLVARFHAALCDFQHRFHFTRPGAHDTPAHLCKLEQALAEHSQHRNYTAVAPIAQAILEHAARLAPLPALPTRIVHGDLKISNVLFASDAERALALLDLDTMAHMTIPLELGDAFRSWCNPSGEDAAQATFRADVFRAAVEGYATQEPELLTIDERDSLVSGAQLIALELAARFCADALYETYFGFDASRFATRSDHSLARARSQLSVADSVRDQRAALERIVVSAFAH